MQAQNQTKEKVIMVVDDTPSNLQYAMKVLGEEYKVVPVKSGEAAIKVMEKLLPDLILLDIEMPEMDGYETLSLIKKDARLESIPVIFLTAHSDMDNELKGFQLGAVDFIIKPFVPDIMLARVSTQIELSDYRNHLEMLVAAKTRDIEALSVQTIMAISNAVDKKDVYTRQHSARVAKYAREIATRLGWNDEEITNLYNLALLHDIGKIGIPDAILNKPGRLTDEEFTIMKTHTAMGADILKDITVIRDVAKGAKYHHERYDGRGYMEGLKGEEIPYAARIVGIADAFDAMTSDRAYRKRLSDEIVRGEIEKGRGTQFDPDLVDIMLQIMDDGIDFPDED